MVVGVPREEHEKLLLEMSCLLETLGKTQSAHDATQTRVQALELGQTRLVDQLDILVRIRQPMAGAKCRGTSASKFKRDESRYDLIKPA